MNNINFLKPCQWTHRGVVSSITGSSIGADISDSIESHCRYVLTGVLGTNRTDNVLELDSPQLSPTLESSSSSSSDIITSRILLLLLVKVREDAVRVDEHASYPKT